MLQTACHNRAAVACLFCSICNLSNLAASLTTERACNAITSCMVACIVGERVCQVLSSLSKRSLSPAELLQFHGRILPSSHQKLIMVVAVVLIFMVIFDFYTVQSESINIHLFYYSLVWCKTLWREAILSEKKTVIESLLVHDFRASLYRMSFLKTVESLAFLFIFHIKTDGDIRCKAGILHVWRRRVLWPRLILQLKMMTLSS